MKLTIWRFLVPKVEEDGADVGTFELPENVCNIIRTEVRSFNESMFEVIIFGDDHRDHVKAALERGLSELDDPHS